MTMTVRTNVTKSIRNENRISLSLVYLEIHTFSYSLHTGSTREVTSYTGTTNSPYNSGKSSRV